MLFLCEVSFHIYTTGMPTHKKKIVLADLDVSVITRLHTQYAQTMLHQHTPVLRCHIVSVIFFSRSRIVMLQNERI